MSIQSVHIIKKFTSTLARISHYLAVLPIHIHISYSIIMYAIFRMRLAMEIKIKNVFNSLHIHDFAVLFDLGLNYISTGWNWNPVAVNILYSQTLCVVIRPIWADELHAITISVCLYNTHTIKYVYVDRHIQIYSTFIIIYWLGLILLLPHKQQSSFRKFPNFTSRNYSNR